MGISKVFPIVFSIILLGLFGASQEAFAADFGDAPSPPYVSASHPSCSPTLGPTCDDSDPSGQQSPDADADGADDDGASFGLLVQGQSSSVTLNVVNPGGIISCFNGWIDFNADGDFNDAGENAFSGSAPCGGGAQTLNFNVPAGAAVGDTFARFRVQNAFGVLGPTGGAANGEVEDYKVTILAAPPEADLEITKTVTSIDGSPPTGSQPYPVNVGEIIIFEVEISNNGPDSTGNVEVTDILDAGLALLSATGTIGTTYDPGTGLWVVGTMSSGTVKTLTLETEVLTTAPMTNTAQVTNTGTTDPNLANNMDTVMFNVQIADLRIEKTVDNTKPTVGDFVTYTITIFNDGPDTATNIRAIDTFDDPNSLSFDSVGAFTGTTVNCGPGPIRDFDCNVAVASLASGDNSLVELIFKVIAAGTIVNTAEITDSDQFDPNSMVNNGIVGEDDDATVTITASGTGGKGSITAQDANLGDVRHGVGHNKGFCHFTNCINVDGFFNHFPETIVHQGTTQTFTMLVNCPRGANTCSHMSLAGVLPDSDFYDDQWSVTVDRQPRSDNWVMTTNNPFGEIGKPTVTVQTISQSFISATFNIPFLIPGSVGTHDGIGDPHENNRHLHVTVWDNNRGMSNYIFNEGVYVDDIYAYPQVETSYEKPLEIEKLCLNENPNKRYTCAFAKVKEWTIKNAEKALLEINGITELDVLKKEYLSKFIVLKQAIAEGDLEKISEQKEQLDELGTKIYSMIQ